MQVIRLALRDAAVTGRPVGTQSATALVDRYNLLHSPERVRQLLFLGEENVESSMVDAVSDRWHVTADEFDNFDGLYQAVKAHIRTVA
ncbi:DUF7509 family protein [Haloarcula amylolytica]|uniref:DUF7509 family protein n=1 Tax=Haloarcula amylolytica TaxID=396317 RepID=UPI003C7747CF